MAFIADSKKPNGPGILPLRHDGFLNGGFSLDFRAYVAAVRITGRRDTGDGLGSWTYDQDSPGDLNGGNLWQTDRNARRIPGWAFAWPVTLSASGGTPDGTPTLGGGPPQPPRASVFAFPLGGGGVNDNRYVPKQPTMPFRDGKPGADPVNAAKQAAAAAAAAAARGDVLFLGIGAQVVPFTGGGFPQFGGVRTNFGGSSFPQFGGVRTNFGGSSFPQFSGVPNLLRSSAGTSRPWGRLFR